VDYFTKIRGDIVDWQRNGKFFQEQGYYLDLIGDEAVKLIEQQDKNKPFFLYFASLAPHAPYQAKKTDENRYASTIKDPTRRTYAAMVTSVDDQLGRIIAALEKRGLRENTLIIFSSDNGGPRSALIASGAHSPEEREAGGVKQESLPANNGELRGGKGSLHEGGVRTPTIANWPAKLKPRIVNEALHMVDVMPTVLALAGGTASPEKPLDGKDLWLTMAEGKPSSHEDVLVNVEAFRGAIIKGKWKLVKIALLPGKIELFDLSTDPGEKNNVAEQNPEVVRDLESRLIAYAKQQKQSEWLKAQQNFLGAQGKTILDPDFDIDDGGLPHEKAVLPK
jgi:arylsulfatase A-like enzyme